MNSPELRVLRGRLRALRDPVVRTGRLWLTLPDRRRVPELVQLFGDPAIARWTLHIPFPYRATDATAWLRRAADGRRLGTHLNLQIVRRQDRRLIGGIGLHHLDAAHARAELGYWVGRPFRRQGYAAEAAHALCEFAWRRLRLHRIEARVFPGNVASAHLLRSVGFRREGRLRQSIAKDGRFVDELVFAKLAGPRAGRRRRPGPARTVR